MSHGTLSFIGLMDGEAVYNLVRPDGSRAWIKQPFSPSPPHYDEDGLPVWQWDLNVDHPTLTPSFDHTEPDGTHIHLFLRRGVIHLLTDSNVSLS